MTNITLKCPWGERIKEMIEDYLSNPSEYGNGPIEIVMNTDRVVAYKGDKEYDKGFDNGLPITLSDDFEADSPARK